MNQHFHWVTDHYSQIWLWLIQWSFCRNIWQAAITLLCSSFVQKWTFSASVSLRDTVVILDNIVQVTTDAIELNGQVILNDNSEKLQTNDVSRRTTSDRAAHEDCMTQLMRQRNYFIEVRTVRLRTVNTWPVLCDCDQRGSETIEMTNRNSTSCSPNKKQVDFSVSEF
jgi:hypothetical protein